MTASVDPVPEKSGRLPGTAPVQLGAVLLDVLLMTLGVAGFIPGRDAALG